MPPQKRTNTVDFCPIYWELKAADQSGNETAAQRAAVIAARIEGDPNWVHKLSAESMLRTYRRWRCKEQSGGGAFAKIGAQDGGNKCEGEAGGGGAGGAAVGDERARAPQVTPALNLAQTVIFDKRRMLDAPQLNALVHVAEAFSLANHPMHEADIAGAVAALGSRMPARTDHFITRIKRVAAAHLKTRKFKSITAARSSSDVITAVEGYIEAREEEEQRYHQLYKAPLPGTRDARIAARGVSRVTSC